MPISSTNPATGVIEKTFEPHSPAEVDERLDRAVVAADVLRSTSIQQRAEWLIACAQIIEGEVDELAPILTAEMGKTLASARSEVLKCGKGMRFYAANAQHFLAEEPLAHPSDVGASIAYTRYDPLGVILAIMPWNYPLWQVIRFAAPALMAGNAGVLKHASNVPQAAIYLDSLFTRGGFPEGSFSSLLIEASRVDAVLSDRRVAAATITGSEAAGREVAQTAGRQLKKVVLELGGSDPYIVMPSANVSEAARVAVNSRIVNNGQSCIAAKRFIVHEQVYEEFRAEFVSRMSALRVGDPMRETTDVGPLATATGRRDLAELVDDALAKGASAAVGGVVPDGAGWFYPPTVLENVTAEMLIHREEAFGPVATMYRVGSADDAVRLANGTAFGLSSSLWSTDRSEQDHFVRTLDAGAVFINGMTVSHPELPFGGIKNSGYGRELSAVGIREFCNLKTIWSA